MSGKKQLIADPGLIERQVFALAEPLVAACGAELIDVEYAREAGERYLRLFIDREPPVDLDLCEQVSHAVDPALDAADLIREAYYLEVSSPGLERPLRRAGDFSRFAGRQVALRLYAPKDGKKDFSGALVGLDADGCIRLLVDGAELPFPQNEVARVHLLMTD